MLGSDFTYVKTLGRVAAFRSFGPSLTWAQQYTVGLGMGLQSQTFPSIENFEAGGPSTLRGYEDKSVGPPPLGEGLRTGGAAVVVLNQEMRYHHATGLGAAVFYDVGNVYERIRDIDFSLRHSIGAGLRYDSPVGLLRFDIGVPLNRRETDRSYQYYFSLGQAF